jgi:hypothetical protein
MKTPVLLLAVFSASLCFAQNNVGIGTVTPTEKLDVNGNVNITGTIKVSGVTGAAGQLLSTNGSTLSWTSVETIYKVNTANYLSVTVPQYSYVKIEGAITLSANYTGLGGQKLIVLGGVISGNGTTVFSLGTGSVINGTSFNNVDITGSSLTFINCSFSGICPNIGLQASFVNCSFSNVTVASGRLGVLDNCSISGCDMPRISDLRNSEVSGTVFGNGAINQNTISTVANNVISSSTFYALQNEFVFTGNKCRNVKLNVGNSVQTSNVITISNNQFNSLLPAETSVIEINPTTSYYRVFVIQNNAFLMQPADFSSIRISGTDGNPFGYSIASIQNNTFWRGSNTLSYSGNMKVLYTNNTINAAGGTGTHPGVSGNLQVANNFTL